MRGDNIRHNYTCCRARRVASHTVVVRLLVGRRRRVTKRATLRYVRYVTLIYVKLQYATSGKVHAGATPSHSIPEFVIEFGNDEYDERQFQLWQFCGSLSLKGFV